MSKIKKEYKVTVIIPVYNVEKYLRNCLESLVYQTIDMSLVEVLMINDGSTDGSLTIMQEYAKKYPNFFAIDKQNEGVSKTRNYGITHARGKYLFYLDSDDTISSNTIEDVTNFFEEHYDQVDMVTYKIISMANGCPLPLHYRYNYLTDSGVYNLLYKNNFYISQTTMNICVKNQYKENILFDEEMEMHEDQKYCIDILRQKMTIGYCATGQYIYIHQSSNATQTKFYAYYMFEPTMSFWENLFASYSGNIPAYIQALFINDLNWKTRSDILLPYHYSEKQFQNAKKRIINVLNQVSDDIILNHPGVDKFHKQFFIQLKDNNDVQIFYGNNTISAINHGKIIFQCEKMEIVLRKFRMKNNTLRFMGYIKSAIFNWMDKPDLYMIKNDDYDHKVAIPLKKSAWSYYKAKTETNTFWLFDLELDLQNLNSLEFIVDISGNMFETYYYFMNELHFSTFYNRYFYIENGYTCRFHKGIFYFSKTEKQDIKEQNHVLRQKRNFSLKVWLARNFFLIRRKKYDNVWLYMDCEGIEKDNGYYQFIHDFEKNDGVMRFYIHKHDKNTIKRLFTRKQRKYLVKFNSIKHRYLHFQARKIITAYIEWNNRCPFSYHWYPAYADIDQNPEIIYLQHGILHAHTPWKYSLDRLAIDKEVISTTFEYRNLTENYNFRKKDLITAGMPRYDFIKSSGKSANCILYAPSWRKFLIAQDEFEWVAVEDKFVNSTFYKESLAFLNSPELEALLQKTNYKLHFKLHPIFARYQHLYTLTNDRVSFADASAPLESYQVFITDFSSFTYDFVYLKRSIIYFFPDYDMFLSGMNDYRELDLPFEEGFGKFTTNYCDTINALKTILQNGGKSEEKYAERMKNFFLYSDDQQRERIYQAIITNDNPLYEKEVDGEKI